jgi:hypothetical protein
MLRALRVTRCSLDELCDELLMLKVFRHTLTSLSLEYVEYSTMELEIVRDAVPNIKFLGLRPAPWVSPCSVAVQILLM